MARLPDRSALGERDPRSVRAVPNYPLNDPVADAMGNAGRALQGAGSDLVAFGVERRETDNRMQYARAVSGLNAFAINRRTAAEEDQDFATLPDRVNSDLRRERERLAATIPDRRMRERFMLESEDDLARSNAWAVGRARGLERDRGVASLSARLEDGQRLIVAAADDTERTRLIGAYRGEIEAAVEKGWLTAQQAQDTISRFQEGASLEFLRRLPPEQRVTVLRSESAGEAALVHRESSGNPRAVNQFGFAGLYQFGAPRLASLGVYTRGANEDLGGWNRSGRDAPGKWSGTFSIPGFESVRTLQDFLANPEAQRAVYRLHVEKMDREAASLGLDQFIGQEVGGVVITRDGLRNMMHLGGAGGARDFLRSGGQTNRTDANGTSIADYARMGAPGGAEFVRYLSPSQQRQELEAAEREIAADETGRLRAATEAANVRAAQLDRRIIDLSAGRAQPFARSEIEDDPLLTEEKRNTLLRRFDETEKDLRVARDTLARISDPGSFFDPTNADDRRGVDLLFSMEGGVDRLRERNAGYTEGTLIPLIERTGIVPRGANGALMGMVRTGSPADASFALATMDAMERANPQVFAADMGARALEMVNDYRAAQGFKTDAEIVADLRRSEDPAFRAAREDRMREGRELAAKVDDAEILRQFDQTWLEWSIFGGVAEAPSPIVQGAMRNEFRSLFAESFARGLDEDRAKAEALQKLATVWGRTTASTDGTARIMRRPPELHHPPIDRSHDWMREQFAADVAPLMREGDRFAFLQSDAITEAAIQSGAAPSYPVLIVGENGAIRPAMDDQGNILRMRFDARAILDERVEAFERERAGILEMRERRETMTRGERRQDALSRSRERREADRADVLEQAETEGFPEWRAAQETLRTLDEQRAEGDDEAPVAREIPPARAPRPSRRRRSPSSSDPLAQPRFPGGAEGEE